MSNRGDNFVEFGAKVLEHVENYTVPQYGDAPNDRAEKMTAQDCIDQVAKYVVRFGKGRRGKAEQLRDMFKIAHYASLAHEKMERGE